MTMASGSKHAEIHDSFTVALVHQAIERYEAWGRQEVVRFYNTPESRTGDWYVFIVDEDENVAASHPTAGALDYNVRDRWVDSDGYRVGDKVMSADEDGTWLEYLHTNPATSMESPKRTWVIKHDGLIFGSGWYMP